MAAAAGSLLPARLRLRKFSKPGTRNAGIDTRARLRQWSASRPDGPFAGANRGIEILDFGTATDKLVWTGGRVVNGSRL
ncbi:hypothetical protein [Novosphingobium sp.]|uniref:hypothetical protein n=1 Tax=Novosphingobium sp. TaxID=1874826 RepID=UPI0025D8E558|nr:hypothetical protein [Novosphingobium sp.]